MAITVKAAGETVTVTPNIVTPPPPPPPASSKTLYGAGAAGWWSGKAGTAKESRQAGTARIAKNWPGIKVWRDWETIKSYIPKTDSLFLDNNSVSSVLNTTKALLAFNPNVHWLSCWHEPENDGTTIANWQNIQKQAAQIVKTNGQGRIRYVSLLMGQTGIPSRNPPQSAEQWFNFDLTNVDCIGADLYQNGTSDTNADTAAEVLGPWIALAKKLNKPLVIGEFGTRRVAPRWSSGISDAARAKYLTDCIALMDSETLANGDPVVQAVMYYESDSGNADRLPWNLLPPPGESAPYSPKAAAVWASACARAAS